VTFVVNVTASTELKKPIAKRETKSASFEFRHGEDPWDTLLARMLSRIDQILSPKKIGIEDYDVTFYIPRILPKPGLPLVSEEHYKTLSTQIDKIALQTPTVNIIVLQKPAVAVVKEVPISSGTRDEDELDASSSHASRGNKKKKDATELPGNIRVNKNIQLLHDVWLCKKPDSACPSTHCYVTTSDEHFPLSHEHFNCWAAAMLKGTEHATITKPPNHRLFDAINTCGNITQEKLSPILQRRLAALEPKSNTPQVSSPVINVTLGNDILGFAHTSMAPQIQVPQPEVEAANNSLLPTTRTCGEDLPILEFCTCYDLGNSILKKLQDSSFHKARSLRFLTLKDLKEMGFVHGEVAELRDA
ncbi:hypothetical protein EDD15DRAFT_2121593, partial [Pisolithus albus]